MRPRLVPREQEYLQQEAGLAQEAIRGSIRRLTEHLRSLAHVPHVLGEHPRLRTVAVVAAGGLAAAGLFLWGRYVGRRSRRRIEVAETREKQTSAVGGMLRAAGGALVSAIVTRFAISTAAQEPERNGQAMPRA